MTNPSAFTQGSAGPVLRVSVGLLAAELSRITPRDKELLDLLDQHRTLTTEQITALSFTSPGRARNRLADLHRRGVLDRFRLYQRPGSQSWRWTLGPVGAALVAAAQGKPIPRPVSVRDATARLAAAPTLGHLLAVNGFFVALAAHARHHPGTRLVRWWNEARCRQACANLVRPDGHGAWATNGRVVPFWLEMDLGSEVIARVTGKFAGYANLGPRRAYPVLIVLPNPAREDNLHTRLARDAVPDGVSVATATMQDDPAGPVWRQPGAHRRVRITDLPVSTVDGQEWDE